MSITRRDLLYMMAATGATSAAAPAVPLLGALPPAEVGASTNGNAPGDHKQPNILFILTDQHSPAVLGCYGDPVIRTPNLDRLAHNGVLFENVYCGAPLCVPSRMSLLTGRFPSENRVWDNSDMLSSAKPTFAHSLAAGRYETALIGRMHFLGPDQHHGFEKRLVGDVIPSYPGEGTIPLSPNLIPGATEGSSKAVTTAGPGHTGYESYDADVTKAAVKYLHNAAHSERPFCAVVGFVLPHSPFVCSKQDWDYYYPRITVPQIPPDYFQRLHPAVREWRRDHGVEDLTEDEIRRGRAGYYGLVAEMDRNIGTILAVLHDTGLEDNTIVVYTSDHGEMAGENGMWWKFNFYEHSVRVPLIISWPGHLQTGARIPEVVSLVDLAPTLYDLGSTPQLPHRSGFSLKPFLTGQNVKWENLAFSELPAIRKVPATRMVRKGDWKLVHFEGMRPQLFDLKNDPHEFSDLGADPQFACIREELLALALSNWSAHEIDLIKQERAPDDEFLAKWAHRVQPQDPDNNWKLPAGANMYSEKS